jgi:chemotaxis protein CheX
MDVKYINPFLDALVSVLGSFGVGDIKRGSIQKKENMHVNMDITSLIGLVGGVRGNIAYSFSQETARQIVSKMMMGAPVIEFDEISRSAIGELANIITGTASGILSGMMSEKGTVVDTTPPSIIFGRDIYFMISSVPTIAIGMDTQFGKIEINIGLEI